MPGRRHEVLRREMKLRSLLFTASVVAEQGFHVHFDTPLHFDTPRLRFQFTAFNHSFEVDAWRNDNLFAAHYTETVDAGTIRPHRHCHYHAKLEGGGTAAFSTCGGGIDGRFWVAGHDLLVRPEAPSNKRRLQSALRHTARPFSDVMLREIGFRCGVHDEDHNHDHDAHEAHEHEPHGRNLAIGRPKSMLRSSP